MPADSIYLDHNATPPIDPRVVEAIDLVAAKPKFELVSTNALGSREDRTVFNSSPAVMGSKLLIRSHKALWCIGK